ncbi:DUF6177 family protein [Pseudarthrobacter sp. PvP090]|uniref:DUF6177 family protein n=1 Tax=Pseudarthrobacter sp. PvP090 TaxID=3156393 RepID=UPI003395B6BE
MSGAPLTVVPLSGPRPWLSSSVLAGLRGAVLNSSGQRVVTVRTDRGAQPSYPLLAFLRSAGIPWVTPAAGGALADGSTGASLPEGRTDWHATAIRGSVLHEATGRLRVGEFTAGLLHSCTGLAPELMGLSEPLGSPWDPDQLTVWLRQRMPVASVLLAGPGFAGAVTAYRTESGVVEAFDVLVERETPAGRGGPAAGAQEAPDQQGAAAAALAANVQELSIERHFGAEGLGVRAGADHLRVPELLVLGPAWHRGVPADPDVAAVAAAELAGVAPFRHLVLRFRDSGAWDLGRSRAVQQRILGGP